MFMHRVDREGPRSIYEKMFLIVLSLTEEQHKATQVI